MHLEILKCIDIMENLMHIKEYMLFLVYVVVVMIICI